MGSPAQSLAALLLVALPWLCHADELDRYIAKQTRVHHFPGVVLGVLRNGQIVDVRARGLASVELGVRADRRHRFEIGSISKQFTAYAVLVLHERGLVELQAPVGRYLDGLPAAWAAVPIERLLTHTSGLPDLEAAFGYGVYRETPRDAEFLARLLALPIDFAPGERWSYSNTNYWLLARVIEQVSGQDYGEFMQCNVFLPLHMSATRSSRPAQLLPGRAAGYRRVGDQLENRWEREQLRPTLVSRATAELARQPAKLNDGSTFPYGYGLDLDKLLPRPSIQHTGQMAGFTAAYVRVPELRLAAVVFVNAYGSPVDSLAIHALRQAEPSLRQRPWQPQTSRRKFASIWRSCRRARGSSRSSRKSSPTSSRSSRRRARRRSSTSRVISTTRISSSARIASSPSATRATSSACRFRPIGRSGAAARVAPA